jgi:RNA-splicing ligase RtcB
MTAAIESDRLPVRGLPVHDGLQDDYVTRKAAVSAKAGQVGIIPGSMGARSYIVRGKGNPDSFESCSHGAGRVMSRGDCNLKG